MPKHDETNKYPRIYSKDESKTENADPLNATAASYFYEASHLDQRIVSHTTTTAENVHSILNEGIRLKSHKNNLFGGEAFYVAESGYSFHETFLPEPEYRTIAFRYSSKAKIFDVNFLNHCNPETASIARQRGYDAVRYKSLSVFSINGFPYRNFAVINNADYLTHIGTYPVPEHSRFSAISLPTIRGLQVLGAAGAAYGLVNAGIEITQSDNPVKESIHQVSLLSAAAIGGAIAGAKAIAPCSAVGALFPPAAPFTIPACIFGASVIGGMAGAYTVEAGWQLLYNINQNDAWFNFPSQGEPLANTYFLSSLDKKFSLISTAQAGELPDKKVKPANPEEVRLPKVNESTPASSSTEQAISISELGQQISQACGVMSYANQQPIPSSPLMLNDNSILTNHVMGQISRQLAPKASPLDKDSKWSKRNQELVSQGNLTKPLALSQQPQGFFTKKSAPVPSQSLARPSSQTLVPVQPNNQLVSSPASNQANTQTINFAQESRWASRSQELNRLAEAPSPASYYKPSAEIPETCLARTVNTYYHTSESRNAYIPSFFAFNFTERPVERTESLNQNSNYSSSSSSYEYRCWNGYCGPSSGGCDSTARCLKS